MTIYALLRRTDRNEQIIRNIYLVCSMNKNEQKIRDGMKRVKAIRTDLDQELTQCLEEIKESIGLKNDSEAIRFSIKMTRIKILPLLKSQPKKEKELPSAQVSS